MEDSPAPISAFKWRLLQFVLAASTIFLMFVICDYFTCFLAFKLGVVAMGLQSVWSLSMAVVDFYAGLAERWVQGYGVFCAFTIGNWLTSTLTFVGACASAATIARCVVQGDVSLSIIYFLGIWIVGIVAAAEFFCCSITLLLFLPALQRSLALLPTEDKN